MNFDTNYPLRASGDDAEKDPVVDERDMTDDLEDEELESALDDEEEEEEPLKSDGQLVYEVLTKRGLVTDGSWFDLTGDLREKWEKVASDWSMGDVNDELRQELKEK